ncbi:hypothetical protein CTI14_44285, partial [Methylobacterium radiotolerans]
DLKLLNQLLVEVVDPQGRPVPGATYAVIGDGSVKPVLPPGWQAVSSALVQGTGNIISPTEVRYQPGYNKVRFVARQAEGQLVVEAVAVYGTQRIAMPNVPFDLKLLNQLLVEVVDPQGRPVPGATYAVIGDGSV